MPERGTRELDNLLFHVLGQVADLKEFIDYLGEGYSYFLEGDDDAFSALSEDYVSAREAESARAEEIAKDTEEAIERLTQRIQEVRLVFCRE